MIKDQTIELDEQEEKPRSIRFHPAIWEALDLDAKRCRRSAVKQLEALLIVYYKLGDVELNELQIEDARSKIGTQTDSDIPPTRKKTGKEHAAKARVAVGSVKRKG